MLEGGKEEGGGERGRGGEGEGEGEGRGERGEMKDVENRKK